MHMNILIDLHIEALTFQAALAAMSNDVKYPIAHPARLTPLNHVLPIRALRNGLHGPDDRGSATVRPRGPMTELCRQ